MLNTIRRHVPNVLVKYQLWAEIPKGNFGLELEKVKKLKGGRGQEKVRKIFTSLVLIARPTMTYPNLYLYAG